MRGRVLIADDSAVVRVSMARRLRALGMVVVERDSTASALTVDPWSLTCALLDIDLGDGLGTEIAAHLRQPHPTLPIAFFSAKAAVESLSLAQVYGPVFVKPDDLALAVEWVHRNAPR